MPAPSFPPSSLTVLSYGCESAGFVGQNAAVHFSWTPVVGSGIWYTIESWFAPDNTWRLKHTSPIGADSAVVVGLTDNVNTSFRIRAVNADGASGPTEITGIATGGVPANLSNLSNPTGLTPVSGANGIDLTWTPTGKRNVALRLYFKRDTDTAFSDYTLPWWSRGHSFTNLLPGRTYHVKIAAAGGGLGELTPTPSPVLQVTTLAGDPPLQAASVLSFVKGRNAFSHARWLGEGTIIENGWSLDGAAPEGLSIAARLFITGNRIGDITGIPSVAGIFDTSVIVLIRQTTEGETETHTVPLRIFVEGEKEGGGLFLPWFHDNPERRELQFPVREGQQVTSGAVNLAEGWTWVRGDKFRLHIMRRDGAHILPEAVSDLRFIVRAQHQFNGPALLSYHASPPLTETINTRAVPYFDVKVSGEVLNQLFKKQNRAAGANEQAVSIPVVGELQMTVGTTVSTRRFNFTIAQDYSR